MPNVHEPQLSSPPSGPWTGFFLEQHHSKRGWMHLFLNFLPNPSNNPDTRAFNPETRELAWEIKGEGTDYVGPWRLNGEFSPQNRNCRWAKVYEGKHRVQYAGAFTNQGIVGKWNISGIIQGGFHIWPAELTEWQEKYMQQDLQNLPATLMNQPGLINQPRDEPGTRS